jgi:uracil-DNA glycosylase family protein
MSQQLELFQEPASAGPFGSLAQAREAARGCVRCDLAAARQQVMFGEGAPTARLMIVGEGPSEADDASGHPFSGPSGRLLGSWLQTLGLAREQVWLTNVVRCRPAIMEGGRLRNRPPRAPEIAACRLWMNTELSLLRPAVILCIGATAGRALLGREFKMTRDRGRWLATADGIPTLATYNPAYVLRLEDAALERAQSEVARDLASVRERLGL